MPKKPNAVTVHISDSVKEKIRIFCHENELSQSEYIRDAIDAKIRRDARSKDTRGD